VGPEEVEAEGSADALDASALEAEAEAEAEAEGADEADKETEADSEAEAEDAADETAEETAGLQGICTGTVAWGSEGCPRQVRQKGSS
jgi:hypothetical protein